MTTEHKNELAGELFTVPESLSPRLAWLHRHALVVCFDQGWANEGKPEPWSCYKIDFPANRNWEGFLHHAGFGDTEEAACAEYARKNDVKHWSAESP